MTEDYYEIPILDLLTIPNDATRWTIIKKALAADIKKTDTKAVEFAYRDLAGAERHLMRLSEETSEFINVPVDLEPTDEADKYSGGPKLLAFAKKHGVRKAPVVIPAREEAEPKAEEPAGIETTVIAESAGSIDDRQKEAADGVAEPAVADVPAIAVEDDSNDFDPRDSSPEELDRPVQEDLRAEEPSEDQDAAEERSDEVETVSERAEVETFHVDLDAVLAYPDEKARWILLKKLVAFVRNRKYVRSLSAEDLGDEANATALLRSFGSGFDIPAGGEPKDKSDESRHAISLEAFATGGIRMPDPRAEELSSHDRPEVAMAVVDVQDEVEKDLAEGTAEAEPLDDGNEVVFASASSDVILARFDIHLDDGVNEAMDELAAMGDEDVLVAAAEVLARRLELEASNLRLRIAAKAYRN